MNTYFYSNHFNDIEIPLASITWSQISLHLANKTRKCAWVRSPPFRIIVTSQCLPEWKHRNIGVYGDLTTKWVWYILKMNDFRENDYIFKGFFSTFLVAYQILVIVSNLDRHFQQNLRHLLQLFSSFVQMPS